MKYLTDSISVKDTSDIICQICPLAKQSRNSFSHSNIKSKAVFELIHVDVWGPYRTKTHSGCNQFVTIPDDFSRYTWIHMIKFKSEVADILQNFIHYAETQFATKVLCVRSDNALEFCEGRLKVF